MRRASPQVYGGRRINGGYKGDRGAKLEVGNIWEVVSALANALQDARDQLVNLMNTSKTDPMRMSGGRGDSSETSRLRERVPDPYSPNAGVRNVHRGHAHGHVAFGSNSEYPVHPTPIRARPRPIYQEMSPRRASPPPTAAAGRRCNHPLHAIRPAGRSVTPRRSGPPQVAPGRRNRACVNISSRNGNGNVSPDPGRHCIGTQYAALLRQEALQLRERRFAEESGRDRRPSWSR